MQKLSKSKKGVQQKGHELFNQKMHMLCISLDVTHGWEVNVISGGRGRRGSSERGLANCWISLLSAGPLHRLKTDLISGSTWCQFPVSKTTYFFLSNC